MGEINLRQLRYLIAVAEERHFGRAAQKLHISQPSLSQQVKLLEARLGVQLFVRTTRHVELTEPGRVLYHESKHLEARVREAVAKTIRANDGLSGHLRIGFGDSAVYFYLSEIIPQFHKAYPDVELELVELPFGNQVSTMLEGGIEVALLRSVLLQGAATLTHRTVGRERLVALLPASHHLAQSPVLDLCELAALPFIMFTRGPTPGYHEQVLAAFAREDLVVSIAHQTPTIRSLLALIGAGEGFSVGAETWAGYCGTGVVTRPIRNLPLIMEMAVVWQDDRLSEGARRFIDVATSREWFAATPDPAIESAA